MNFNTRPPKEYCRADSAWPACPRAPGKTVLALYCISERAQPSAVIVHTKELLYQWKQRALDFLDIREQDIGLVGDGKKQFDRSLTICVVNSLYKCAGQMKKRTGHLIVDECHRIPSRSFTAAVKAFDCKYMLGLSATPFRRDGLTPLISFYVGDPVCEGQRHGPPGRREDFPGQTGGA